jgi:hypothetical protein
VQIIQSFEATRDETLKRFQLGEPELARSYAPGKWSVQFILHHLADAETVLFDRLRRALREGRSVLRAFGQDAWANGLDYAQRPLNLSQRPYESARDGIIHSARINYSKNGHLEFVHSETGIRTLKDELDKVAAHNEHHPEQLRTALHES